MKLQKQIFFMFTVLLVSQSTWSMMRFAGRGATGAGRMIAAPAMRGVTDSLSLRPIQQPPKNITSRSARSWFGLPEDYTATDVKNQFRDFSKQFHPDRGGSHEDMQRLNQAKELLLSDLELDELNTSGFDEQDLYNSAIKDIKGGPSSFFKLLFG